MATLEPEAVAAIFADCLYRDGEDTTGHVAVEGVVMNVGFNPARLHQREHEIAALLDELPDTFKASGGGGMSFLNACEDRHGNLWTGQHRMVEQLLLLGIATDRAAYLMPRELWVAMPGGMPYFVVKDKSPARDGEVAKS